MASKGRIFLFYGIALCSLSGSYGLRPFVLDHETVKYEFNSDIVKSMKAKLFEYRNHNALNATLTLREDLQQFNIVTWTSTTRSNGKPWTLYNITFNGCQFLQSILGKMSPLIGDYLKELRKYSPNIPSKCPLRKNVDYSMVNFYLNEELFPVYLPEMEFRTFFGFTQKFKYVFKVFLTGYVAARNGQKYRNRTLQSS